MRRRKQITQWTENKAIANLTSRTNSGILYTVVMVIEPFFFRKYCNKLYLSCLCVTTHCAYLFILKGIEIDLFYVFFKDILNIFPTKPIAN